MCMTVGIDASCCIYFWACGLDLMLFDMLLICIYLFTPDMRELIISAVIYCSTDLFSSPLKRPIYTQLWLTVKRPTQHPDMKRTLI
ncbi:hypothetical protein BJX61DRAFT_457732 [Aspergillus egyptiacus]|nr:hypothetical protein BJX61DRAFT_457732 [Aspergillus egyptiacus]